MIAIAVLLFGVALTPGQSQIGANTPEPVVAKSSAVAQASAEVTPVPEDPAEILRLATTTNGVDVPSATPWHVKLAYDRFDDDGDNVESGAYEEFYAGAKRYKRIHTGDKLNQTDVANDSGLYRSGDQRWIGYRLES